MRRPASVAVKAWSSVEAVLGLSIPHSSVGGRDRLHLIIHLLRAPCTYLLTVLYKNNSLAESSQRGNSRPSSRRCILLGARSVVKFIICMACAATLASGSVAIAQQPSQQTPTQSSATRPPDPARSGPTPAVQYKAPDNK